MLFATVTFEVAPAVRERFIETVRMLMRLTRTEEGCIVYTFAADLEAADRFHIFEIWTSQEAVDKHMRSEHARAGMEVIARITRIVDTTLHIGDAARVPMELPKPESGAAFISA